MAVHNQTTFKYYQNIFDEQQPAQTVHLKDDYIEDNLQKHGYNRIKDIPPKETRTWLALTTKDNQKVLFPLMSKIPNADELAQYKKQPTYSISTNTVSKNNKHVQEQGGPQGGYLAVPKAIILTNKEFQNYTQPSTPNELKKVNQEYKPALDPKVHEFINDPKIINQVKENFGQYCEDYTAYTKNKPKELGFDVTQNYVKSDFHKFKDTPLQWQQQYLGTGLSKFRGRDMLDNDQDIMNLDPLDKDCDIEITPYESAIYKNIAENSMDGNKSKERTYPQNQDFIHDHYQLRSKITTAKKYGRPAINSQQLDVRKYYKQVQQEQTIIKDNPVTQRPTQKQKQITINRQRPNPKLQAKAQSHELEL